MAYLRGTFASSLQFNTFFHFAAQRVKIGPVMISLNIGKVTLLVADSLASKCQDVQQSQVGIGLECMRRWSLLEHNSVTRPDTALPAKMHKTNKTEKVAFFIIKSELLHFSSRKSFEFSSLYSRKTISLFFCFDFLWYRRFDEFLENVWILTVQISQRWYGYHATFLNVLSRVLQVRRGEWTTKCKKTNAWIN